MSESTKFDLSTSEGGRGYLENLFQAQLKRHDFTNYIRTELAADFACTLSQYIEAVRAEITAGLAREAALRVQLDAAATSLETISKLAGRDEFMKDVSDVRGYANSRAGVVRAFMGQPAFLPSIRDLPYDVAQKIDCELPPQILPGGHTIGGLRFSAQAPAVTVPERSPGDQIAALMMIDGIGEGRASAIYRRGFRLMPQSEQVVADPILVEAVAVVRECDEEGLRLDWLLEGGIAALEHAGTVLLVAHGTVTNDEGHGYVIPVKGENDE